MTDAPDFTPFVPACRGVVAEALLPHAAANGLVYVPDASFYATDPRHDTWRLSFATVPPQEIERGIALPGRLLKERVRA